MNQSAKIQRLLIVLLFVACYWATAQQVKVMTFNIWHGGRETGEEEGSMRVVNVIGDWGADIVAMQETYGSGGRIAEALGYHFYLRSTNLSILSRYPIVDTVDAYETFNSGAVTIDVDGHPVVVVSNWLNYPFDYWDILKKGQPIDSTGLWRTPEIHDRIDLVYVSKDRFTVHEAGIIGEQPPMTDIVIDTWPSDHQAVVVELPSK